MNSKSIINPKRLIDFSEIVPCLKNQATIQKNTIDPSDTLQSLGFQSITFIELIVQLEEKFQIEFDDQYLEITSFPTVQDLINYLNIKLN